MRFLFAASLCGASIADRSASEGTNDGETDVMAAVTGTEEEAGVGLDAIKTEEVEATEVGKESERVETAGA